MARCQDCGDWSEGCVPGVGYPSWVVMPGIWYLGLAGTDGWANSAWQEWPGSGFGVRPENWDDSPKGPHLMGMAKPGQK